MAYDTKELERQALEAIESISIDKGCHLINEKFINEKEFVKNLLPKIRLIIKAMYNLDVKTIETEKYRAYKDIGYYNVKYDIYITTEQGQDIAIECKNPIHEKSETFNAIAQMMSYIFINNQLKNKPIVLLATSKLDFYFFEVLAMFNLKFDVILNNRLTAAYWINTN